MMSKPDERSHHQAAPPPGSLSVNDRSALETTVQIVTQGPWRDGKPALAPVHIPVRYDIREADGGGYLRCLEAPGVGVAVDLSYGFSEAEARKLGAQVVLLDGAGQFGPRIDSARKLYNLDHHRDCPRAFTLASCEQALVLVVKGLELDQGDWKVCANEPDLDTLFAIWVLLNHRRIRAMAPPARDAVTALVRLEGAIDANGFEVAAFCGLPLETLNTTRAALDQLQAREAEATKDGGWSGVDLLRYVRDRLIDIDRLVYRPEDFGELARVERDFGHVGIGGGRVAVMVGDSGGIYDVEKRLKSVWGERLGIIALAKSPGHYTLRRVASLSDIDLELAYHRLNQLDPAVDGFPPQKRWGGSDEIGGSPRPDGSALKPPEIVKIMRLVYCPSTWRTRLRRLANSASAGLGALVALAAGAWLAGALVGSAEATSTLRLTSAGMLACVLAFVLSQVLARESTWQLGWRWPAAGEWLLGLPLMLAGAALGGVLMPHGFTWDAPGLTLALGAVTSLAGAFGLWFFGLAHGLLARFEPVQLLRGRWFLSRPAITAAILYAGATFALDRLWGSPYAQLLAGTHAAIASLAVIFGALLVGVGAAVARERSLSVLPPIAGLVLGALLRLALTRLG